MADAVQHDLRRYLRDTSTNSDVSLSSPGGATLPIASTAPTLSRSTRKINSTPHVFRFPAFRNVLWDRTPIGEPELINFEQYVPSVEVPMNVLVQAVNFSNGSFPDGSVIGYFTGHWQSKNSSYQVAISSFTPNPSFDDRDFDDADNRSSFPFIIKVVSGIKDLQCTSYRPIIRKSMQRLCSRKRPDLSQFLKLHCSLGYRSAEECALAGEIIAPAVGLSFTSINAIRLVSNSLSTSLQDFDIAEDSTGYLTLDQFRNAVPLYDNDGSIFTFPLVGIWVYSNVSSTDAPLITPHVWAACLRFLYNDHIKDRVTAAAMTFLVLIVKADEKKIRFLECAAVMERNSQNPLNHFDFGGRSIRLGSDSKSDVILKWRTVTDSVRNEQFRSAFPDDGTSFRQESSVNEKTSSIAFNPGMVTPEKSLQPPRPMSPDPSSHPDISMNGRSLPLPRPTPQIVPYPHPVITPGPYSYETYSTPVSVNHRDSMPFASPRDLFERQQIQFEYLKEQVALLQAKFDLDNERRRQHDCSRCDRSPPPSAPKFVASKGTSTGVSLGYERPAEFSPVLHPVRPVDDELPHSAHLLQPLSEEEENSRTSVHSTSSGSTGSQRMSILELSELDSPVDEVAVESSIVPVAHHETLLVGESDQGNSVDVRNASCDHDFSCPGQSLLRSSPASAASVLDIDSPSVSTLSLDILPFRKSSPAIMELESNSDDDENDVPRIIFTNSDTSSSDQDDESSIIARRYNLSNTQCDDSKSISRGRGRFHNMLMREIGAE